MKYVFLFFVCIFVAIYLVYKYTGYSVYDLFPPKEVAVRSLTKQEMRAFTPPIAISEKIYQNTPKSISPWVRPLYEDKKTIVFVNWNHQQDDFFADFKNLFRSKGYSQFYRKQIFILSSFQSWKYDSLKELILNNCDKTAVCIINPKTKQMAVLPKDDPSYLAAFLEKYKNW